MKTIVIGSGLAGLMAAYISKKRGEDVTLLASGAGTLAQNSGCIDILAYTNDKTPVTSPREAIENLPETHPYKKIGIKNVEAAANEFLSLVSAYGLPYCGDLDNIIKVPTPIGALKSTSYVPYSMNGAALFNAKKIVIVDVERLKDFYGDILRDNLTKHLPQGIELENITIDLSINGARDVSTIDAAKRVDLKEGFDKLVEELRPHAKEGVVFLLPQILGLRGDKAYKALIEVLKTPVIETTCLPSSVNGMRLVRIFCRAFSDIGIDYVENTRVIRGVIDKNRVEAVVAKAMARNVKYEGDKFILATGGFLGGGITLESFNNARESIFRLPVWMPEGEKNWSNEKLFGSCPQGFATAGIMTDNALRPVDRHKSVIYENLFVIGRNLGGYDLFFEHSGNGVALASAYHAAVQSVK